MTSHVTVGHVAALVRSERVVLPRRHAAGHHPDRERSHRWRSGRTAIPQSAVPELDVGALVVLPGLVDTHVHINDPGRAEWEGFEHATRPRLRAASPRSSTCPSTAFPPRPRRRASRPSEAAAAGQCHVDVGFWGGLVPGNRCISRRWPQPASSGSSAFSVPSGVDGVRTRQRARSARRAARVIAPQPAAARARGAPALLRDPLIPSAR